MGVTCTHRGHPIPTLAIPLKGRESHSEMARPELNRHTGQTRVSPPAEPGACLVSQAHFLLFHQPFAGQMIDYTCLSGLRILAKRSINRR